MMLSFLIFRKMRMKKRYALGFSADITVFVLFFSVLIALYSVWGNTYISFLLGIMLCVGLIVTFLDWRTKNEIDVPLLLKRIWRLYFLLLSALYVIVCMVGLIMNVVGYIA